jgi:hypothetical protein
MFTYDVNLFLDNLATVNTMVNSEAEHLDHLCDIFEFVSKDFEIDNDRLKTINLQDIQDCIDIVDRENGELAVDGCSDLSIRDMADVQAVKDNLTALKVKHSTKSLDFF